MKNTLLLTLLLLATCAAAQRNPNTFTPPYSTANIQPQTEPYSISSERGVFYLGDSSATISSLRTGSEWNTITELSRTSTLTLLYGNNIDCKPFESFSNWEAKEDGVKTCDHSWVYAEYGDVNWDTGITTLEYCPCGCADHENQARICSKCLRHESRVRTYGYKQVPKPVSEYKKLLGKTKQ